MIWNFWLWKCAQFLSAPFIILIGLTMAWYREKKVISTTGYDLMPNSQKKSLIISLVFSQDPSVWCWVFGGGLGPGGFKFRILISLVSVCFWKFKKVGNSKVWICKGFFNGSGLKNIALHENGVFSVLIKWYLHAIILPPEPVPLSVIVVTVALHLLQFTFTGCSPKSMILKL